MFGLSHRPFWHPKRTRRDYPELIFASLRMTDPSWAPFQVFTCQISAQGKLSNRSVTCCYPLNTLLATLPALDDTFSHQLAIHRAISIVSWAGEVLPERR